MARPKKIHHFKITPFTNAAGTKSWRVAGTKTDGTRVRKNFADKAEAIQTMADLESEIAGGLEVSTTRRTRLTAEQLASAEAAVLAAGTRDVSEIVSHYLALESRARSKKINLDAALSFVESHYRSEIQKISMLTAYDEFIESRVSSSPKTKENYESCLKLLLKPDPNRTVHEITISDIEKILNRYKNLNSKRTYRRAFKTFFSWAVRHHYCLENPCDRLDKLPRDMSQIAALSLEESTRLLYAAMLLQDGAAAASVAIGLFAGLRPSEICDLKPEDIIRHTSITFQTVRDMDEARTAFNCGTSIQMMNRHYRDSIDDQDTIQSFWNLTPEKLRAEAPEVELEIKRRVDWPAKAKLKKLVWQKPLIHAAKDLGVSDIALRKHCVKLGIELPPRGHWLSR